MQDAALSSLSTRNHGIDILRGISIIIVILLHCYIHMPFTQSMLPPALINVIFRSGHQGVMIFFVISGFLITTISLRRWQDLAKIKVSEFYRMRFARIMPCLLGLVIILSLLDIFKVNGFDIHTTTLSQAIFAALTFHINWLEANTGYLPGSWDVLWSLSIEEVFYLGFPIICLLCKRATIVVLLAFVIIAPFARTIFTTNEMWSDTSYLACIDGIAIGCIAGLIIYRFQQVKRYAPWIFFMGVALFIFSFGFRKQVYQLGISNLGLNTTLLDISVAMLLIAMTCWPRINTISGSPWFSLWRWFGRYSYEIYLTHMFFVTYFSIHIYQSKQTNLVQVAWYVMVLILSGLLGRMVALYFSEPLNQLIRKPANYLAKPIASYNEKS